MRWKQFFTPVQSMDPEEARAYLADKTLQEVTILDVRQPGEYEEGHIPGAKLVPLPVLTDSLDEIDSSLPVLVYCAIGGRSRVAAQTLSGLGYGQVINLSGGFRAWTGQAAFGAEEMGVDLFSDLNTAGQILAMAYSLEKGLRDFYVSMAEEVHDERVRSLFAMLAGIEIKHQDRLFEEYARLSGNADRTAFERTEVAPLMEGGLTTSEYLERFHPDLANVVDVVSMAMSIEAQALDLYIRAASWADDEENRAILERIASEEKTHLGKLGSCSIPFNPDFPGGCMSHVRMLTWFGHSSFLIQGSRTVYLDPYQFSSGPVADLILITHSHYDHCSPEDVAKIAGPDTVIVTEKSSLKKLSGDVRRVAPGETLEVAGARVLALPAYNVGKKFHPRKNGWLGFVLEMDGVRFYHAGDTDHIPEMADIRADVALLPVSGTYVMTAAEAAAAARDIKPGVAVPMHYGSLVGEMADAEEFQRLLAEDIRVEILPKSGA